MRKLLALLSIAALSCATTADTPTPAATAKAFSRPTTIIVVRHAEAVQTGSDPELTEAGKARAEALVAVAESAGVKAVYTTQLRRTRDTAAPLAAKLGLTMETVPVDTANVAEHPRLLARRILAEHAGETVLVVGHSNTVPMIVAELTGVTVPKIAHPDNSRLFVVTHGPPSTVIAAQYGCP